MGVNSRKFSQTIFMVVGALFAVILVFQWFLNEDDYTIEIQRQRENRHKMFTSAVDTPLPDSLRDQFKGLEYFPVDRAYRIVAKYEPNLQFQRYEMPQTAGDPEIYIISGWLNFKIRGKAYKLTAFAPNEQDSKTLFVPFRDATSGKDTYGGGRYIDTRISNNKVILDFNRAYNPYCVYNYDYACPIPPIENDLKVAIEAGEKDFTWEK